ncbi:cellulase family glycosylhydrolase [Pelagicoccus sp. SDUM812002]|uniref:glycoside hydrolase family 5 protein n=1 Tax=Pelagicoccus sp. SDUM812002 TaxID=3041266 RepID=UPI00280EDBB4|nr:cellulase family glycosylhydrolase [Pelagicoccus sp. SDUM812002]MDQ8186595.1 cellulase family glycosylhydrolase [Pelagicoccus sp. SDUM812002]
MSSAPIPRRDFIRKSAVGLAAAGITSRALASAETTMQTKPLHQSLPKWKGFNFLDFFVPNPQEGRPKTAEESFKWMRDWGFDFVRIPMAYPYFLDIDYDRDITPDEVYEFSEKKVAEVDAIIEKAHKYGLHVSLNLHRAPGYCINAGFHEPYNLWTDQAALDAFCHHWGMWSNRYSGLSKQLISFDLLNEPSLREDMNDQHGKRETVPPETYHRVAKAAVQSIRQHAPDHLIVADGNNGGHVAVPELADLDIAQSCRGYFPFDISHHKAPWVYKDTENLPPPKWPDGPGANRRALEEFYKHWFDLQDQAVGVHCGECGCYNETPHDVFLAWFGDVLSVLAERDIGFALWEMHGDFGILDSGRSDVDYEDWYGHKLDRKLLELLRKV